MVEIIYKQQLATLKKHFFKKSLPTTATRFFQLPTYPTTGEVSHQYLLKIRIQCSTLSKKNKFSLCRKRCAATIKLKSLLMILQSLQFFLFCVQKMIFCQIVTRISKKLYLPMTLCTSLMKRTSWPIKIWIVILLSTMKLPQKSDRSMKNGITFPDPLKNPSAFPLTINITVSLMRSINLLYFWTRTFYGTWFQQLLCHSTTLLIDTLCPKSNLNQQITNIEQTQIRCSLYCDGWTVKGRDCASALNSFKEITYQTDKWTKQKLRLKNWVISGNPGQGMEFRCWWRTLIVFKCSYLFHLFEFYCLLVQYLLFFCFDN